MSLPRRDCDQKCQPGSMTGAKCTEVKIPAWPGTVRGSKKCTNVFCRTHGGSWGIRVRDLHERNNLNPKDEQTFAGN